MKKSPTIKKAPPALKTGKAKAKTAKPKAEPNFLDKVYEIVRKIPRGRATSYGAIAESAGIRLSARMVGWAMHGAERADPPIAAHRVVNSKGLLTGKHHFATPTLMQELLENEGIRVIDNQIQDFKSIFWDPAFPDKKAEPEKKKVGVKKATAKEKTGRKASKAAKEKASVKKPATKKGTGAKKPTTKANTAAKKKTTGAQKPTTTKKPIPLTIKKKKT